uniref:Glycosyl transferase CAP10 domain-containing protein n=1 Tax=Salmo trutta TaxID=8032 RepID=A0A674ED20_SALTR
MVWWAYNEVHALCLTSSVLLGNGGRWQIYLEKITKATQQYKPCSPYNCSCHLSVLNDDLRPIREGVSEELMSDTLRRGVGTHYQIINGKLNRTACSQCSGVEHFILQVIDKLPDVEMVVNVRDYPQVPGWVQPILPVQSFSKVSSVTMHVLITHTHNSVACLCYLEICFYFCKLDIFVGSSKRVLSNVMAFVSVK